MDKTAAHTKFPHFRSNSSKIQWPKRWAPSRKSLLFWSRWSNRSTRSRATRTSWRCSTTTSRRSAGSWRRKSRKTPASRSSSEFVFQKCRDIFSAAYRFLYTIFLSREKNFRNVKTSHAVNLSHSKCGRVTWMVKVASAINLNWWRLFSKEYDEWQKSLVIGNKRCM